jgi:Spy/CpxP family protein refolding chaperone
MRRIAIAAFAALALAACSNDTTSPDAADLAIDEGMFGTALTLNGAYDAGLYRERLINALPDSIKLTDEQKESIRALVNAFEASTKADREALAAILREARQAIRDHKSREEIREILSKADPYRDRLHAAERKLVADIDAVLTPAQRAWIQAHKPQRCRPDRFPPLSDEQKAAIRTLESEFREDNKADLDSLRSILEEARAAIQAGKSRQEIAAILAKAAPIARRLADARKELHEDILDVLTPEQKASRCFPLG